MTTEDFFYFTTTTATLTQISRFLSTSLPPLFLEQNLWGGDKTKGRRHLLPVTEEMVSKH